MSDYFQELVSFDDEDNEIFHPIFEAVENCKAIESVEVGDEWSDDHCPCINVTAIVDGKEFKYSDWYLSSHGLRMYYHAECGGKKGEAGKKQLVKHFKEYKENY